MRIKVTSSNEVLDAANAEALWSGIRDNSAFVKHQSLSEYFDGVIVRLHDVKVYLEPPAAARLSDNAYSEWMLDEFKRIGRMSDTDEPTTIEQKAEAAKKKAEAAKKKAEAAKAKAAEAAALKDAEKTAAPASAPPEPGK